MSKKQIIILAALGVFVLAVIVWGFLGGGPMGPGGSVPADREGTAGEHEEGAAGEEAPALFTPEVPMNATPTTPAVEAPAAPGRDEHLGIFDMTVSASGYDPSALTVRLGDLVQIRLTASGGDYDFSMPWSGLYQSVKNGETKQVSFQTTAAGTYLFQCQNLCPSGRTISGNLIVVP